MEKPTQRRRFRSRTATAKKVAIAKGTAWIFAAIIVGLVDLRFLAIPPLGIAGAALAAFMAIVGLRHIRRGKSLTPQDLLELAYEREAGLLNIATIVQAFGCDPAEAYKAMEEAVSTRLFEDVTPLDGKTFIIRSLTINEELEKDVVDGQNAMERAMQKLEADLSGDKAIEDLEAQLESARSTGKSDSSQQDAKERG